VLHCHDRAVEHLIGSSLIGMLSRSGPVLVLVQVWVGCGCDVAYPLAPAGSLGIGVFKQG